MATELAGEKPTTQKAQNGNIDLLGRGRVFYARARAVRVKIRIPNRAGLGKRRMTCQTIKLIEWILRAGETANESSKQVSERGYLAKSEPVVAEL
jgi:hypothetical protein